MWLLLEDGVDQARGLRPDVGGSPAQTLVGPAGIAVVRARHVLGHGGVAARRIGSQMRGERPAEPRCARPTEVLADRRPPQAERLGDQPLAHATGVLQAQDIAHLAHRQSLGWHGAPRIDRHEGDPTGGCRPPAAQPPHQVAGFVGFGARIKSESVAGLDRIQWPLCLGMRICGSISAARILL